MVERLQSLLALTLRLSSPVLSGNMKSLITQYAPTKNEARIVIDAPFYDMKQWKKTHVIVHTGAVIGGRTAYAEWVNRLGGFATHNASEGWVHRAILDAVRPIAEEMGAEIVWEL